MNFCPEIFDNEIIFDFFLEQVSCFDQRFSFEIQTERIEECPHYIDTSDVLLNFDVNFFSTALSVENGTKGRIFSFYKNVNVKL